MRFMTEKFRVSSLKKMPMTQIPPKAGFITAMPSKAQVRLLNDRKQQAGFLYPFPTEVIEDHIAVCLITESHGRPNNEFPLPGVESFLCEVTYGVEVMGMKSKAVVRGPRLVQIGKAFVDKNDGLRTVKVEIIEMYLSGYDPRGSLITVKGGRNFDLPALKGEIKALSKESDFPARISFDLELEVVDWATEPSVKL
jgi:hypothetical protein